MYQSYFDDPITISNTKQKTQTISYDNQEFQTRKQSRSFKEERSQTIHPYSDEKEKKYSVYKTPTNAKRKNRGYETVSNNKSGNREGSKGKSLEKSKNRGRSENFRRLIGSPFSKIKVKSIVESGSFVKEIGDVESRIKAPVGYKILKGIGIQPQKSLIFVAEKIAQKLVVYIQLNPSKHLLKFYKHFFNEDKIKRAYLKSSNIRLILAPKHISSSFISYSFQGQWVIETELQSFIESQSHLEIKDTPLGTYLKDDPKSIKKIVLDLCRLLTLLEQHKIIHGHLRKSSLLAIFSSRNTIKSIKVFGFDRWMYFKEFQLRLQELVHLYTPPEVLNFICFEKQQEFDRGMLTFMETYNDSKSWLFDMWAVGIILLELVLGFPLYLNKESATLNGVSFQPVFKQNTTLPEIIQKQMDIIFSLQNILKEKNSRVAQDVQIRYLLKMMLNINPSKRLSPKEVINYLS